MERFNKLILNLNQRWLYLLTFIIPFVVMTMGMKMKVKPEPVVQSFYDEIEVLAKKDDGKIVLISGDFGPSTKAECYPQTEAVIEHLFRAGVPFAMITLYAEGAGFIEEIPNRLAKKYGKVYGEDYCVLGYKPNVSIMVQSLSRDIPRAAQADVYGTPITEIPMMKDVKDVNDVSLVVSVTGLVGMLEVWLGYFPSQEYRPNFAHGCTAIAYPEAYVYIDSGQLIGLMNGMAGAAQYEYLLGIEGAASEGMVIHVFFHGFITILIILGNIAYFSNEMIKRKKMRR